MLKDSNIISFCGLRNAGKSVSAEMLKFLLNTPSFLHFYWVYKCFPFFGNFGKWKTTSFAKPLKEVLGVILGVPAEKFENREFKENYCVDLDTAKIYYCGSHNCRNKLLTDKELSKLIKNKEYQVINKYYLTIRQCLQYIGTEILRTFISDKIWINASLKGNNLIFGDLRFKKEFEELDKHQSFRILIERPGCLPGNHASEKQIMELKSERTFEGYIDNNGTLKDLFCKIKQLTDDLYVIK